MPLMTKELIKLTKEIGKLHPEFEDGSRELVGIISDMIRRKKIPSELWHEPYIHPKFTYQRQDGLVILQDGTEAQLSSAEQEALDTLIVFDGHTVRYDQIDPTYGTAVSTVKRLSRKLEGNRTRRTHSADQIIQTVRKVGVRMPNPLTQTQLPKYQK